MLNYNNKIGIILLPFEEHFFHMNERNSLRQISVLKIELNTCVIVLDLYYTWTFSEL